MHPQSSLRRERKEHGNWESKELDEAATELCDCPDAEIYTKKKMRKESAVKAIKKQFGQQSDNGADEDIIETLNLVVDLIVENKINSATIDIGNGLKAKIGITAKGFIKVERAKLEKQTQEA